MAGRKPKYSPERVEIICKGLSEGKPEIDCCKMAGISVPTFHRWLDEKKEFQEAVKKAKAKFQEWYFDILSTSIYPCINGMLLCS